MLSPELVKNIDTQFSPLFENINTKLDLLHDKVADIQNRCNFMGQDNPQYGRDMNTFNAFLDKFEDTDVTLEFLLTVDGSVIPGRPRITILDTLFNLARELEATLDGYIRVSNIWLTDCNKLIAETATKAAAKYDTMTVVQLRNLLRQRGLKVSGNKKELIQRLQNSDTLVINK